MERMSERQAVKVPFKEKFAKCVARLSAQCIEERIQLELPAHETRIGR